jgi:hypothetical protein
MPFFFIIPVWLLLVAVGLILLFFARFRMLGYFVIAVPTGATVISFLLSTSVFSLFCGCCHCLLSLGTVCSS